MTYDEPEIGVTLQNAGVEHVGHGSAGVEGKFDNWSGAAASDATVACGTDWMDKNRRGPFD
jgi:hypothetical protein